MKNLAKQTVLTICVFFTVAMIVSLCLGYAFAGPSYGLNISTSLLLATAGMGILQAIWFSGVFIRKLSYPVRIACFGVMAFFVISGCALIGAWFPIDNAGDWLTFALVFVVILVAMTTGYTIYYRRTVGSYKRALARYRERELARRRDQQEK